MGLTYVISKEATSPCASTSLSNDPYISNTTIMALRSEGCLLLPKPPSFFLTCFLCCVPRLQHGHVGPHTMTSEVSPKGR